MVAYTLADVLDLKNMVKT